MSILSEKRLLGHPVYKSKLTSYSAKEYFFTHISLTKATEFYLYLSDQSIAQF
jgi:hypothetical protein